MPDTKTSVVHHITGKRFLGVTPDGHRLPIDGENDHPMGMRPMDLLLNAVGACAAYDIVEMIAKRRIELRDYRIELSGERNEEVPRYFTKIHARHVFDAPGLDIKTAQRFVELGMTKYCSVAGTLKSHITYEVELEHEVDAAD